MFRRKYFFLFGGPVVSDEGFTVSFEGRCPIIYEDEQGKVIVDGEMMVDGSWVLYENRMWVGPAKQKIEDKARRTLIVQRVLAAAQYQRTKIDVDDSP